MRREPVVRMSERVSHALEKVRALATRTHVPEVLVLILAGSSIWLGIDMVVAPESEYARAAFTTALAWAPASTWGIVLVLPSTAALAVLAARRRDLYWPLAGMTLWFCAWSAALIDAADAPGAVNSAAITYGSRSMMLALLALMYFSEGREAAT